MDANIIARRAIGGTFAIALGVVMLTCGGRAVAAVTVPNAALSTVSVPAMSVSAIQTLPTSSGNPTHLTVVNKTGLDNSRGIASLTVSWINTPPGPQTVVSTGTSTESGVISGQHFATGSILAEVGLNVTIRTETVSGIMNKYRIRNDSGDDVLCTIHTMW